MPGVLLHHVHHHVARFVLLSVDLDRRVEVERGVDLPRMVDLAVPELPGGGDQLGRGRPEGEAGVLVVEEPGQVLSLQDAAEPVLLDPGEVPDQSEQGERRGRHGPPPQLLGVEVLALQLQGHPVAVEVAGQHRLLAPAVRDRRTRVGLGVGPHVVLLARLLAHGPSQLDRTTAGQPREAVPAGRPAGTAHGSVRLGERLLEADHVADRVAEGAVAYAVELVGRLLQDLGAGGPDVLEGGIHVGDVEDER